MPMRYDKTDTGMMVQVAVGSPADDEWRTMLDWVLANKGVLRGVVVFVHGDGGPSAKQRSDLAEVIKVMRSGFRTAVLTDSHVTRGILTALNWLTKKQNDSRSFPLNGFDEAMAFLELNAAESRNVRDLAHKLGAFAKPGQASAK